MASKKGIPSAKKNYKEHKKRLGKYSKSILNTIQNIAEELCKKVNYNGDIADVESIRAYVADLVNQNKKDFSAKYVSLLNQTIKIASSTEWGISDSNIDKLVNTLVEKNTLEPPKWIEKALEHNTKAVQSFLARRDENGSVVSKLQKQSNYFSTLLGESISSALAKGKSAVGLAQQVQDYLNDVNTLRGDYRQYMGDEGKAIDIKYTAMRLARSEINSAYKLAEEQRYKNLDFVVGYEVHRSGDLDVEKDGSKTLKKDCDICESLKGKYPKDFVFSNWHPNCLCYITPILNTDDEFWAWDGRGERPKSVNEVTEPPQGFTDYVNNLDASIQASKTPYFMRNNIAYVALLKDRE